jgi:hypothetical protein
MKKPTPGYFGKATKSLLAGSMLAGTALLPSATQAQGNLETVNFGGPGVTGTISFNPSDFVFYSGGSTIALYTDPNAVDTYTVGGVQSVFQGAGLYIDSGVLGIDEFGFVFGPDNNDGAGAYLPLGTISAPTLLNAWTLVNDSPQNWITTPPNQPWIDYGYDINGNGGTQVDLTSFVVDPVSTPEPSTVALGALGAVGLLARRYSFRRAMRQPAFGMK